MIRRKIGILDIKQALYDERFCRLFPEMAEDIKKSLQDPACPCNRPLYSKLLDYPDRLKQYWPNGEFINPKEEVAKNNFLVINCHIKELEKQLRRLPPGRKEIAVARYEEQVTVVINDLGIAY
jgi:hypothetical protein